MIFDLTQRGVAIPAGSLTAQEFTRLRSRLTVKHMGFGDRLQTMQCYTIDRKTRTLYAARMRGAMELARMGHEVRVALPEGEPLSHDVRDVALTLKDYQRPIMEFLTTRVYNAEAVQLGVASCYLDLQPGRGKTYIIMALIQQFARKSLIVVPGKELVVQTVTTLRGVFPQLQIGEYWTKTKRDGDIVVMTSRSACAAEYKFAGQRVAAAEYFARFGFAAFDEVHTLCTRENQEIFMRAACLRTFGCSGTSAEREDQMDEVAYMHIGKPIPGERLMVAAPKLPEWRFRAHCLRYNGPAEFTETLTSAAGTVSCARMVSQFSKDPWRSQWLVDVIRECVAAGHQTFVMLDRTELCKLAWDYLSTAFSAEELAMTPGVQAAGIITGRTPDSERAAARRSRVIVGTYACVGTGLSFDEFSAVVFWHPRRNKFRQFLNRIFRENGDRGRERLAYFLQDNSTSIKTQYQGFSKTCRAERQVTPEVTVRSWRDIEITPRVKKISDDFIAWDAARQRDNAGEKNNAVSSQSSDEEWDEGLD